MCGLYTRQSGNILLSLIVGTSVLASVRNTRGRRSLLVSGCHGSDRVSKEQHSPQSPEPSFFQQVASGKGGGGHTPPRNHYLRMRLSDSKVDNLVLRCVWGAGKGASSEHFSLQGEINSHSLTIFLLEILHYPSHVIPNIA